MQQQFSFFDRSGQWLRDSIMLKVLTIGFLILMLLIPVGQIQSLIYERQTLRDRAVREVSSKWGGTQTIGGPVLTIPYRIITTNEKGGKQTEIAYAHFLPNTLNLTANMATEKRYRGIYPVLLYNSKVKISGQFLKPDFEKLGIAKENYLFPQAFISMGISDLKGVKDKIPLALDNQNYTFDPGIPTKDIFPVGVSVPINFNPEKMDFDISLDLNGSASIYFLPFGKETNISVASKWPNPSFEGAFLPDSRTVTPQGFNATWKVIHLNRNYPQQGVANFITSAAPPPTDPGHPLRDYYAQAETPPSPTGEFGLRLLLPVDEYSNTNRSVKYAIMFIAITFIAFFFIEILNKKHLHPFQYLLVGFSICIFYLLLVSLSEHTSFNIAYLLGCTVVTAMITFYSGAVLHSRFLASVVGALLIILYGFFYGLLQLEDYALLIGTFGMLAILATLMYLTRNIDWYNIKRTE